MVFPDGSGIIYEVDADALTEEQQEARANYMGRCLLEAIAIETYPEEYSQILDEVFVAIVRNGQTMKLPEESKQRLLHGIKRAVAGEFLLAKILREKGLELDMRNEDGTPKGVCLFHEEYSDKIH